MRYIARFIDCIVQSEKIGFHFCQYKNAYNKQLYFKLVELIMTPLHYGYKNVPYFISDIYRILNSIKTRLILRVERRVRTKILADNPQDDHIQKYLFHPDRLNLKNRKRGISGLMTLRGALADNPFLEMVIDQGLKFFDEVICVYNEPCQKLPVLFAQLETNYPKKFKAYHYQPYVYPPKTEVCKNQPVASLHILSAQRNYALMKSQYHIATKFDDDNFMLIPPSFKDEVIKKLDRKPYDLLVYSGLNVIKKSDGLHIPLKESWSGNGDICFWSVCKSGYYFSRNLDTITGGYKRYKRRFVGVIYIHLKHLKKDFGYTNYKIKDYLNSDAVRMRNSFFNKLEIVSLKAFRDDPENYLRRFEHYHWPSNMKAQRSQDLINKIDQIIELEKMLTEKAISSLDDN